MKVIDLIIIILLVLFVIGIIGLAIYVRSESGTCLRDPVGYYEDLKNTTCMCIDNVFG